MSAYYNEHDAFAAAWLRELIADGQIAAGDVDERDIHAVTADDLRGYAQCHFFAGIGGWSYALRLADWPDDRPVWTGSCPCQTFSSAARGRTVAPDMWPEFRRLIAHTRPRVVFGEQVHSAHAWFDGVCADMETLGYAIGAAILPAVFIGADHARLRMYFVGDTNCDGQPSRAVDAKVGGVPRRHRLARGVVRPHGVSTRMVALSGFGNAIVPQVAAEVIRAYLESS